jgi:HEPN domain-containing protein
LDDGAVGFHAQRAVEKTLEVAIVLAELELPRSRDLEMLAEQAAACAPLPEALAGVDWRRGRSRCATTNPPPRSTAAPQSP